MCSSLVERGFSAQRYARSRETALPRGYERLDL